MFEHVRTALASLLQLMLVNQFSLQKKLANVHIWFTGKTELLTWNSTLAEKQLVTEFFGNTLENGQASTPSKIRL